MTDSTTIDESRAGPSRGRLGRRAWAAGALGMIVLGLVVATGFARSLMVDPLGFGRERYVAFLNEQGIDVVATDPVALQTGVADCGVAALEAALRATGHRAPSRRDLAARLELGNFGVTLSSIERVARELGVSATIVRGASDLPPARHSIALLKYRHFVVVRATDAGFVYVFDPMVGELRIPKEAFKRHWSGKSVRFPSF